MWAGPEGAHHVLKGRSFSIVFKQREEALVLDEAKKMGHFCKSRGFRTL